MNTIILTASERHPIEPGVLRKGESNKVVLFFGLHKSRGDRVIYSTRVTDGLYDVIRDFNLSLSTQEPTLKTNIRLAKQELERFASAQFDFVGIAYGLRHGMSPNAYKNFLIRISDALENTFPNNLTK